MSELALIIGGALLVLAAAYGLGSRLTARLELVEVMRFGVGTAALSWLLFALVLAGWFHGWIVLTVCAAAIAVGFRLRPRWKTPGPEFWVAGPFVIYYGVHALSPEIQPDGYTYHLGLAAEWVRLGGLADRVGFYEVMPQGIEALFAAAMAGGGHSSAKLIHFAFLLALLPLMGAVAGRPGPAGLLVLFAPVAAISGTSAYNDVALAFFALAAFHAARRSPCNLWIAGLLAGFCYAVKLTGLVYTAAILLWLAYREGRSAWKAWAAAGFIAAPWMLRTWCLTGNPLAPFANGFFGNPHFHAAAVDELSGWLRTYDTAWYLLPVEVTVRGVKTGGLIGPAFLAAVVIAVLPKARTLMAAALVAMLPWFLNAGTRFLIPSLPFLALAMVQVFPARVGWALAIMQALLCSTPLLNIYARDAWRLRGFPISAALRVEPEEDYLRREMVEYSIAELANANTKPGERIFDLTAAPTAYMHAAAIAPWQHASAGRVLEAMRLAAMTDSGTLIQVSAPVGKDISSLRVSGVSEAQEIELRPLFPSREWVLQAAPNIWEAAFAFDRNAVSGWKARTGRDGVIEVRMPGSRQVSEVRVLLRRGIGSPRVEVESRGAWSTLQMVVENHAPLNPRLAATRLLRREGFCCVLAQVSGDGYGPLSGLLAGDAADWGLEVAGKSGNVYWLRARR